MGNFRLADYERTCFFEEPLPPGLTIAAGEILELCVKFRPFLSGDFCKLLSLRLLGCDATVGTEKRIMF